MTPARLCPGCGHEMHNERTTCETLVRERHPGYEVGPCGRTDYDCRQASLAKVGEAATKAHAAGQAHRRREAGKDFDASLEALGKADDAVYELCETHLAAWPVK